MIGKLQNRPPMETDDPVELSSRAIDDGSTHEMTNRVIQKLAVLDDDIAIVESFSHLIAFRTDAGLLCFDASGAHTGGQVVDALRSWSTDPIHTLVYTHGHLDHVGGSGAMAEDAADRGHRPMDVVAHARVADRFERYRTTNDWNISINSRQFGGISRSAGVGIWPEGRFLPESVIDPTTAFHDRLSFDVAGLAVELRHDLGETDDHAWAWLPEHRALCVGDFVTWVFPNCGNPQKVQRYPREWAAALREMMTFEAEWLFGAHGLPVRGANRVRRVLDDLATALEQLVEETLQMMNDGASLNDILHSVSLPADTLERPWMMPIYDEPEFVVRNIWRLYGGWWDLNPAHLKPATDAALGTEVSALAGGPLALAQRAQELAEAGDHRLAGHLIEMAAAAAPDDPAVHGVRAEVWQARRDQELSLMSKGIYAAAANDSNAHLA